MNEVLKSYFQSTNYMVGLPLMTLDARSIKQINNNKWSIKLITWQLKKSNKGT